MKILQLCHKPPFPPNDGGTKAMHANTVALQRLGHEVHILTIETPKHPVLWSELKGDYIHKTDFTAYFENTTPTRFDAFRAFIGGSNYHLDRFDVPEFHALLQKKLDEQRYDIVWLESLYVACYVKTIRATHPEVKCILRAHNIEHKLWQERLAEYSFPSSMFIKKFNKQLAKAESSALNTVDVIAAISDNDCATAQELAPQIPAFTLPYFVDQVKDSGEVPSQADFGYVGALDWEPNIQGVIWLVHEVWPSVKQSLPEATLRIAGRNMDSRIQELAGNGIEIMGEIDNAEDFMRSSGMLLAPLFSSSGIRIKLIEAFALNIPVVASTAAIDGLHHEVTEHTAIADTPNEFAAHMISLHQNSELRTNSTASAYAFYQKHYSEAHYLHQMKSILEVATS